MSNPYESLGGGESEFSEETLTTEERCLRDLLNLDTVDQIGRYQPCSEFFVALNNQAAPESLRTSISPHKVEIAHHTTYPEGADVVATVTVGFDSKEDNHERLHNIDFVRTDDGLKAFKKSWFMLDDERVPRYVRELDTAQLAALAADAATIAKTIQEIEAERLKLGPLTEEAGPDGVRRFHVGDILSVITGRMVSPRGMEGIYDILGYMTHDSPYTTQLGRFAEECKPHLHQQVDKALAKFYEPSDEAMASTLSVYKWLGEIGDTIGGLLLTVKPIGESDHAVLDPVTELVLDHGNEVMKKIISVDIEDPEADK